MTLCGVQVGVRAEAGTEITCRKCYGMLERKKAGRVTLEDLAKKYPGYQWRYTSGQTVVKHAIDLGTVTGQIHSNSLAVCGRSPVWFSPGWYGTGNQEEYDRLDELRECKACITRLGPGKSTGSTGEQVANAAGDVTVSEATPEGQDGVVC